MARDDGDRRLPDGGADRDGASFADVLNNLFLDAERAGGAHARGAAPPPAAAPGERPPDGGDRDGAQPWAGTDDEWDRTDWDGDDARPVVRPYAWTRGRTRPVQDLAIETLVSTARSTREARALPDVDHRAVAELCLETRSVAEVAALLRLPLGVARVVLADMVDLGLVVVHRNPTADDAAPDVSLLQRVLAGLQRL